MGAGCSSSAANTVEALDVHPEVPSRPVYLAGDLVGPPAIEKVFVGPVDKLLEQAASFAETLCQLNDSLSGLLLDVRLATGLLQGGFSIAFSPSPIVDFFSVELLTKEGLPLDVDEAARLRGRDVTNQGRLAALDARLAKCLEELAGYFIRNVGAGSIGLSLSPVGMLVSKNPRQAPDPAVEAFNQAMMDMRSALGENYLLALHLHKAQGHGMPSFRVHLLKPQPSATATTTSMPASPQATPPPAAAAPLTTTTVASAAAGSPGIPTASDSSLPMLATVPGISLPPVLTPGAAIGAAGFGAAPAAITAAGFGAATTAATASAGFGGATPAAGVGGVGGWDLATVFDQAACLNASRLQDALHGSYDANGRLAAVLQETGLTCPGAIVLTSPRTVALAGTSPPIPSSAPSASSSPLAPTTPTTAASTSAASFSSSSTTPTKHRKHRHHNHHRSTPSKSSPPPPSPQPPSSANTSSPFSTPTKHQQHSLQRQQQPQQSQLSPDPAAAVRALPASARGLVARALEGINAAAHRLGQAAAEAPGPASFAALLTHVLGELRDLVAGWGGEAALDTYQPRVHFSTTGPPDSPVISFSLDPQLGGALGASWGPPTGVGAVAAGAVWGRGMPPFPDCLGPQVHRAWLLLLELLRLHNSALAQLPALQQLATAFEEGISRRIGTISQDAAAARLPLKAAAGATRALVRNHVEIRDCCRSALQTLAATCAAVRAEMAEAAQLAEVQCSFMSQTAWSMSLASSAGVGGGGGSLDPPGLLASNVTAGSAAGAPSTEASLSAAWAPVALSVATLGGVTGVTPSGGSPLGPGPLGPAFATSVAAVAAASHPPLAVNFISSPGSLFAPAAATTTVVTTTGTVADSRLFTSSSSTSRRRSTLRAGGSDLPPDNHTTTSGGSSSGITPGQQQQQQQQVRQAGSPSRFAPPSAVSGHSQSPGRVVITPAAVSSSGSRAVSRVVSRAVSRTAGGGGGTDGQGGWVPVDGSAAAAAGPISRQASAGSLSPAARDGGTGGVGDGDGGVDGSGGGGGPGQRLLRRAAQSLGSRFRAAAAGTGADGEQREGLAEEYARTALAHLQLQL